MAFHDEQAHAGGFELLFPTRERARSMSKYFLAPDGLGSGTVWDRPGRPAPPLAAPLAIQPTSCAAHVPRCGAPYLLPSRVSFRIGAHCVYPL